MRPKTPDEMSAVIETVIRLRAYADLAAAARRGPLDEPAIAAIEATAIAAVGHGDEFADEFPTFQAEIAVADAKQVMREEFAMHRVRRQSARHR